MIVDFWLNLALTEIIGRFAIDVNGKRIGPMVGTTVVITMHLTYIALSLLARGLWALHVNEYKTIKEIKMSLIPARLEQTNSENQSMPIYGPLLMQCF